MKKLIIAFILVLTSLSFLYSQDKKNKIEIGGNVATIFDYRDIMHNFYELSFPNYFFNTVSYSRKLKNTSLEWQFRFIEFRPKNRDIEYSKKKITHKGYDEHFTYFALQFLKSLDNNKFLDYYYGAGIQYRWGVEHYYVRFRYFEAVSDYHVSNDISLSVSFKLESKPLYNFYLYTQPQYNFYFYRSNDVFTQNELQLNFGLGYKL